MAIYDLTKERINYDMLYIGDIINVPFTGTRQQLELPPGKYKLEVWGAQGGTTIDFSSHSGGGGSGECTVFGSGAHGGYSVGNLELINYTQLFCYSGGHDVAGMYSSPPNINRAIGFNGGGNGFSSASNERKGPAGGGGSDIRIGIDSIYARVIVAGGGAGRGGRYGSSVTGGEGGGETSTTTRPERGSTTVATQTAPGEGGSFWKGADFGSDGWGDYGNGAGGGWYGGGMTGKSGDYHQVAGGSGYVYNATTAVNYPEECLLNSSYYLTESQTIAGNQTITEPDGTQSIGHVGFGYCRITVLKINNESYIYVKNNSKQEIKSVSISQAPTKTSYTNGEKFNPSGLQLLITYQDDSTATITPDFKTADMPTVKSGQTQIKMVYGYLNKAALISQTITVS